jgi:hypothetical protein
MKPNAPVHIRLERLALNSPPAGGEARLRERIGRELTALLAREARTGRTVPLPRNASPALLIADRIRRALPSR